MAYTFTNGNKAPICVPKERVWYDAPGEHGLFQIWYCMEKKGGPFPRPEIWACIQWRPYGKWRLWVKRHVNHKQKVVQRGEFLSEQDAKDFFHTYSELVCNDK
jgi:hypothetical protein